MIPFAFILTGIFTLTLGIFYPPQEIIEINQWVSYHLNGAKDFVDAEGFVGFLEQFYHRFLDCNIPDNLLKGILKNFIDSSDSNATYFNILKLLLEKSGRDIGNFSETVMSLNARFNHEAVNVALKETINQLSPEKIDLMVKKILQLLSNFSKNSIDADNYNFQHAPASAEKLAHVEKIPKETIMVPTYGYTKYACFAAAGILFIGAAAMIFGDLLSVEAVTKEIVNK